VLCAYLTTIPPPHPHHIQKRPSSPIQHLIINLNTTTTTTKKGEILFLSSSVLEKEEEESVRHDT